MTHITHSPAAIDKPNQAPREVVKISAVAITTSTPIVKAVRTTRRCRQLRTVIATAMGKNIATNVPVELG